MDGWLPIGTSAFAACALGVLVAYVIFGMTSFGASLIAAPVLAHFLPLALVIPLQATLDLTASLALGGKDRARVDRAELRWLLVPMLLGMVLGVTLLIGLPRRASLVALGAFVVAFGLAGLTGRLRLPPLPRPAAFVVVTVGGVISALFAAGGPVYVMYLTTRIADPMALRATIAAVALLSSAVRVLLFALSGLLVAAQLWWMLALLLPCLLIGVFIGRWLQRRLAANANRAVLYLLLVAVGASLLWRFV